MVDLTFASPPPSSKSSLTNPMDERSCWRFLFRFVSFLFSLENLVITSFSSLSFYIPQGRNQFLVHKKLAVYLQDDVLGNVWKYMEAVRTLHTSESSRSNDREVMLHCYLSQIWIFGSGGVVWSPN